MSNRKEGHPPASSAIDSNTQPGLSPAKYVSPVGNSADVRLEISHNDVIGAFIYKLVDKQSGEVLRQWPSDQMVHMREYVAEHLSQLLDETV